MSLLSKIIRVFFILGFLMSCVAGLFLYWSYGIHIFVLILSSTDVLHEIVLEGKVVCGFFPEDNLAMNVCFFLYSFY